MYAPALWGDKVNEHGKPGQGQKSRWRFPDCFAPSAVSFSVFLCSSPLRGDCSCPACWYLLSFPSLFASQSCSLSVSVPPLSRCSLVQLLSVSVINYLLSWCSSDGGLGELGLGRYCFLSLLPTPASPGFSMKGVKPISREYFWDPLLHNSLGLPLRAMFRSLPAPPARSPGFMSSLTPGTRALTEKEGRTGQQNRLHETAEELIIGTARKGPF